MKLVMLKNEGLRRGIYVEPYAGGAGVALFLVMEGFAEKVYLNDLDRSIYAFWHSVIKRNDTLCDLIESAEISIEEWERQKEVQQRLLGKRGGHSEGELLELGFSTFYLNRTNRSGIVRGGGVIGGIKQSGKWKMDARFNKENLLERIRRIESYADRIKISNSDAVKFIHRKRKHLPADQTLFYLDPPYVDNGQNLYQNDYTPGGHAEVADTVKDLDHHWIVSYDNCSLVRRLYADYKDLIYSLSYSANERYEGSEAMFVSDRLKLPKMDNNSPASVSKDDVEEYLSGQLELSDVG